MKKQKLKVGLFGGSFNPAHMGHLHVSEIARKTLGLRQVWWLVSPGNPLKNLQDLMEFDERFQSAKKIVGRNRIIKVLDLERKLGTRYTVDSLKRLKAKFPQYEFYWLIGADNLIQLPKWKKWQELLRMVPVHVFDRDKYFYKAIGGLAYRTHKDRIHYHLIRKNNFSSTALRKAKKL